jgi:hypothetical protein
MTETTGNMCDGEEPCVGPWACDVRALIASLASTAVWVCPRVRDSRMYSSVLAQALIRSAYQPHPLIVLRQGDLDED